MAHHLYTTNAIVLSNAPGREADKRYILFTRDFGVIRAIASGIRLAKSKLRYSIQDSACLLVALVRGKEFWRITNAWPGKNLYTHYSRDVLGAQEVIARTLKLIRRLAPEEEKNEPLFDEVMRAFDFLAVYQEGVSVEDVASFEHILALRILWHLGYVADTAITKGFLDKSFSTELLETAAHSRQALISTINFSLDQSHL